MEKQIEKFKKLGTVNLIAKLEKVTGEEKTAVEVVLVQRNQPFKPESDIETLSQLSGISPSVLVEKGYFTEKQAEAWYSGEEYNPEEDPEANTSEAPAPKEKKAKKEKAPKEPKEKKERKKKNPKQLTSVEYAILDAVAKSDYHDGRDIVNDPVLAIGMEDVDQEVVANGARLAGGIKTLIRKGFLSHTFGIVTEAGKTESTMAITPEGFEAYQEKDIIEFKGIVKKFDDLDEELLEKLDVERMNLKKEYEGKFVQFKLNVTGEQEIGIVTGAKLDKRTGYLYLNIRVGRETFNKREKNIEVVDTVPAWAEEELASKAAKKAEREEAKKAKEADRKAKAEEKKAKKAEKSKTKGGKVDKVEGPKDGLNSDNKDNDINEVNDELMS